MDVLHGWGNVLQFPGLTLRNKAFLSALPGNNLQRVVGQTDGAAGPMWRGCGRYRTSFSTFNFFRAMRRFLPLSCDQLS